MCNEVNRIIDGHRGYSHITSQRIADMNAAIIGEGDHVFKIGEELRYEIVAEDSGRAIKIYDGAWTIQGRRGLIDNGDSEMLSIKNGSQGTTRSDLVVIRYEKTTNNIDSETMKFMIVNGVDNEGDPVINNETIVRNGAAVHDMPIYRVRLNGINVDGVDKLFETKGIYSPVMETVYPIGSIHMTVDSENPNTYWGFGTWELWGAGKVPVGVNTNDTEFNSVEKIGGEKTHTLTIAQIPSHFHPLTNNKPICYDAGVSDASYGLKGSYTNTWTSKTNGQPGNTGGGQSHNNLQPYITCYMWKRTA